MKKTRFFIFITALLITLLTVVGCDVSPVSHNNELVRACVSIGNDSAKDLIITNAESCDIDSYYIALIPEWDKLENGAPIYGQIGEVVDGKITKGKTYASDSNSLDLGYITPGKWTVYVEALNNNSKVLMKGSCTGFFVDGSEDTFILLQPVTEGYGSIQMLINLQRLSVDSHEKNYKMFFCLEGAQTGSYTQTQNEKTVSEIEMNFYKDVDNDGKNPYRTYGALINDVRQDKYVIRFILKEYNETSKSWSVVGGITRSISVVDNDTSLVYGDVMPSEFIPVELEIIPPTITVEVSKSVKKYSISLTELDSNELYFTCVDANETVDGFNREFIWYVNGDRITTSLIEGSGNYSILKDIQYFTDIGNYEVRCDIVYHPLKDDPEDNGTSKLSFIGGDSVKFQIIP